MNLVMSYRAVGLCGGSGIKSMSVAYCVGLLIEWYVLDLIHCDTMVSVS
jgi:hypothetical protein